MNSRTLKNLFITSFSQMSALEEFSNVKLVFVTAAGIISGNLTTDEDGYAPFLNNILMSITDDMHPDSITQDDGFVILSNVEIRDRELTHNIDSFVLFIDQIIGVSLGKIT